MGEGCLEGVLVQPCGGQDGPQQDLEARACGIQEEPHPAGLEADWSPGHGVVAVGSGWQP